MEIQTKSIGGRVKNYTFKRRRKELWDTHAFAAYRRNIGYGG